MSLSDYSSEERKRVAGWTMLQTFSRRSARRNILLELSVCLSATLMLLVSTVCWSQKPELSCADRTL